MKYLTQSFLVATIALISTIILSCNSSNTTTDKFVGKWNVYSIIDSKNEIGGGKVFRKSIKGSTPVEDLDFEIEKNGIKDDQYSLSGFLGSRVAIVKVDENTLLATKGKKELKINFIETTQHLILQVNNTTVEYSKEKE